MGLSTRQHVAPAVADGVPCFGARGTRARGCLLKGRSRSLFLVAGVEYSSRKSFLINGNSKRSVRGALGIRSFVCSTSKLVCMCMQLKNVPLKQLMGTVEGQR